MVLAASGVGTDIGRSAARTNVWRSSANPVRSYTVLNHENPEFIRFVNPSDFRVAHISCGTTNCHPRINLEVHKSMMTHGCMLWGAAVYNNGMRHSAFANLPSVACPVTISCGSSTDAFGPDAIGAMVDRLPHGRAEVLPRLTHFAPLEDPAAIAAGIINAFTAA